jgi:hypothetical protein
MKTSHLIRRAAVLALIVAGAPAGPAAAATIDPDTLNPPPPPGALCRENGTWIICHTGLTYDSVNAPIEDFGLPCGTLYETSHDVRRGIRWYSSADRTIVKRFVSQDIEGTWSLSPTGSGPTVRLTAHANWTTVSIPDGDLDSAPLAYHGDGASVQARGFGMIAHIAGYDEPDGTHHGQFAWVDDPAVAAELCTALGA